MNAAQRLAESNRRLAILVALSLATRYTRPLGDLRAHLGGIGYPASMAQLRADAAFLADTGLIEFDAMADVLTLTERGQDVALGNAEVPGVGTPGPGA